MTTLPNEIKVLKREEILELGPHELCPIRQEPFYSSFVTSNSFTKEEEEKNNQILQIVSCRHIFFGKELKLWFQNYSLSCPTCRHSLSNLSLTNPNTTSTTTTTRIQEARNHPLNNLGSFLFSFENEENLLGFMNFLIGSTPNEHL